MERTSYGALSQGGTMSLTMNRKEREAFLSGLHVGVISIPRSGRGPLTVPIWYDYEPGGDVWMITDEGSQKGKLLKDCQRISLCVQREAAPYAYVSVEGQFTTRPASPGELEHMAIRYLGERRGKQYAEASSSDDGSIVVSLVPETWLTVDYGKR